MQQMKSQLEKLRTDAQECASISRSAIDKDKEELFASLAEHLAMLADVVEIAIVIKEREALSRASGRSATITRDLSSPRRFH